MNSQNKQAAEIEVVAAVIVRQQLFLCLQKGFHRFEYLRDKFEFPGGKIEKGESPKAALIREIQEELCLKIRPVEHLITIPHQYPDFAIRLHVWLCEAGEEEHPILTEHQKACWLPAEKLRELDWAAADVPVLEILEKQRM